MPMRILIWYTAEPRIVGSMRVPMRRTPGPVGSTGPARKALGAPGSAAAEPLPDPGHEHAPRPGTWPRFHRP